MKNIKFLFVGILFGILAFKSEMLSWYRWQEMFFLSGTHMIGLMICAILTGIIGIRLIKRTGISDINGQAIVIPVKKRSFYRYAIGGLIFGIGWAMAGCPGATYALIGQGNFSILLALVSALIGTFVYGLLRSKLPH